MLTMTPIFIPRAAYLGISTFYFIVILVTASVLLPVAGCSDEIREVPAQVKSLQGINTEKYRQWIRNDPERDKLIVFVHGFNSSNAAAWGQFPSFITEDNNFNDFNVVLAGYDTKLCSRSLNSIESEGDHLASFLFALFESKHPKYQRIVLVGHSMGGLVIVHALLSLELKHFDTLIDQDLKVLTFGTPYIGVQNVETVESLFPFCTNKQREELNVFNPRLDKLTLELMMRFNQPDTGRPTPQIALYTFHGRNDLFVKQTSACGYAKGGCESVDGDHHSIVKPTTRDHLSYTWLQRISLEPTDKRTSHPARTESEVVVQGLMPIHFREEMAFDHSVNRRLAFIVKVQNPSSDPKTVESVLLEGCVPTQPWFSREAFVDRNLLPSKLTFDENLAALSKTAIQKIRTSGAVRADSRVIPAGGIGYIGILLPLPLGQTGAMLVVENSAALKEACSNIPRSTSQPSIAQLLKIGAINYSEPKDLADGFRDGSLKITMQIGGKPILVKPNLLGKLISMHWKRWPSLDLSRMYEVPDTDYPPTVDGRS